MKNRKSDILTCVLFCGFLFTMAALYLILPKTEFSQLEKRYLAEAPKAEGEAKKPHRRRFHHRPKKKES